MSELSYAASHGTVRISAKRFELSPFAGFYPADDTVLGVYGKRFYPLSFGGDAVADYWALKRGVVAFDVPERPLELRGPDAVALLERVMCRRVATLPVGKARYAIACLPDGGMLMDGVLLRLGPDRFWYVQADGEIETWLMAHGAGLDVTVADPRSWVLQVQGPRALDVLAAATAGACGPQLAYFAVAEVAMGGQEVVVSRTGWTGELGFEVYTRGEATDGAALLRHILEAGAPHGIAFRSLESMGVRRIEAGILDNGTDMDRSMTPFAAGLGRFVDLDKPGFVGRDALAKADRRPRLFGLRCATAVPRAGMTVADGDTAVARVTAGAWSPYLDCGIGYACFATAGDWPGRSLRLAGRDGGVHPCKIVPLPFYDPDKRIPRGLDPQV